MIRLVRHLIWIELAYLSDVSYYIPPSGSDGKQARHGRPCSSLQFVILLTSAYTFLLPSSLRRYLVTDWPRELLQLIHPHLFHSGLRNVQRTLGLEDRWS